MKKVLFAVLTVVLTTVASQAGYVHVNGYTRSNGTYVQSHYRTSPDGYKANNLSYRPRSSGLYY